MSLPKNVCDEIDHWLTKFPEDNKQSALLPALTATQKANQGFLTEELIKAVADYLDVPSIAAFEVASFYSMYDLKPVGKHKINVCTNISCMLCGSKDVMTHLKNRLKINVGETTADGQFTLRGVECLAACVGAPMMQLDDTYHEKLTPEKIDAILAPLMPGANHD